MGASAPLVWFGVGIFALIAVLCFTYAWVEIAARWRHHRTMHRVDRILEAQPSHHGAVEQPGEDSLMTLASLLRDADEDD